MRKASLITLAAIILASCGQSPTEEPLENALQNISEVPSREADNKTDQSTESAKEEKEEEQKPEMEEDIIYGDTNCRDDYDCSQPYYKCGSYKVCEPMPLGAKGMGCDGANQQCNGQGSCECTGNFEGENCDICKEGFTGELCIKCAPWHYGDECLPCTCPQKEGNMCDEGKRGNGTCIACADNNWGDSCQHTSNCFNGVVDVKTGYCQRCNEGWSGRLCNIPNDCKYGVGNFGVNGDGKCAKCYNHGDIASNCEYCQKHWTTVENDHCNACAEGWEGQQCHLEACNSTTSFGRDENEQCVCRAIARGPNCDQCTTHWGFALSMSAQAAIPTNDCTKGAFLDMRPNNYNWYWEGWRQNRWHWSEFYISVRHLPNAQLAMFYTRFYSDEGQKLTYSWEEARIACPAPWRQITKAEAAKDIERIGNIWVVDEDSQNSNQGIYVDLTDGVRRFSSADKTAQYKTICVVEDSIYADVNFVPGLFE